MEEYIMIDGEQIWQPDQDLGVAFETTYTKDSGRTRDGVNHLTPLFTVEQFSYSAEEIPADECAKILQKVIGRNFRLHYFSSYHGAWRDDTFFVGKGDLQVKTLKGGHETMKSLKFNMTGINPLRR